MVLVLVYSCVRLLLDVVDIRLRPSNPEAELLVLRHELRVLRWQIKRPQLAPAERSGLGCNTFLLARDSPIVVIHYFRVDSVLLRRLYVLLHMVLPTRRRLQCGSTADPDTA